MVGWWVGGSVGVAVAAGSGNVFEVLGGGPVAHRRVLHLNTYIRTPRTQVHLNTYSEQERSMDLSSVLSAAHETHTKGHSCKKSSLNCHSLLVSFLSRRNNSTRTIGTSSTGTEALVPIVLELRAFSQLRELNACGGQCMLPNVVCRLHRGRFTAIPWYSRLHRSR